MTARISVLSPVLAFGKHTQDQVAVGDNAHGCMPFDDYQGADVFLGHAGCRRGDGRRRMNRYHLTGTELFDRHAHDSFYVHYYAPLSARYTTHLWCGKTHARTFGEHP